MSTQLGTIYGRKDLNFSTTKDLNPISLLQFSGGAVNGKMLQIKLGTSNLSDSRVLLNKEHVERLRNILNAFLE